MHQQVSQASFFGATNNNSINFGNTTQAQGGYAAPPTASRLSSLCLYDEVLFTVPVALGSLSIVLTAGSKWVSAVIAEGGMLVGVETVAGSLLSTADLSGSITCLTAVSLGSSATGARAFGAVGTMCGSIRLFLVEMVASGNLSIRTLHTTSLSSDSSAQLSRVDAIQSIAIAMTATGLPEALLAASRHCLVALSLFDVATTGAGGDSAQGKPLMRTHCSTHSECPIVKLMTVPQQVGLGGCGPQRSGASGGSQWNTVIDHCIAGVVVFENGNVQYLIRHSQHDNVDNVEVPRPAADSGNTSLAQQSDVVATFLKRGTAHGIPNPTLSYRLSVVCTAGSKLPSSSNSFVVVNDAQIVFNDVAVAFDVILCGTEIGDGAARGVGPYAARAGWWCCLHSVLPLLQSAAHLNEFLGVDQESIFSLSSMLSDEQYCPVVDAIVGRWAGDVTATSNTQLGPSSFAPAQSRSNGSKGYSVVAAGLGASVVFVSGGELHSAALSASTSLACPRMIYTFGSVVSSCHALTKSAVASSGVSAQIVAGDLKANKSQHYVISSGQSVHLFRVSL